MMFDEKKCKVSQFGKQQKQNYCFTDEYLLQYITEEMDPYESGLYDVWCYN